MSILIPAIYTLSIVSGNPSNNLDGLFCHSILEYPKGGRLSVGPWKWRDVVLPNGGAFKRCVGEKGIDGSSAIHLLDPKEIESLKRLHQNLLQIAGPVPIAFDWPLCIQISKSGQHIEGICFIIQEGFDPPLMEAGGAKGIVDLSPLNDLAFLRHLELYALSISQIDWKGISSVFTNLEYFGTPYDFSEKDMPTIPSMDNLVFFNISGTRSKWSGHYGSIGFPKVRIIGMRQVNFDAVNFQKLINCPNLNTLLLSDSSLNDNDFIKVSVFSRIECLAIDGTSITDASIGILEQMKNLHRVSVFNSNISESGIQKLKSSSHDLYVDSVPPKKLQDFIVERRIIGALMADTTSVEWLIDEYSYKFNKNYNPIESFAWYYVFDQMKRLNPTTGSQNVTRKLKMDQLIKQMSDSQVTEARIRANAYLFIQSHGSLDYEIPRDSNFPIYQYIINPLK